MSEHQNEPNERHERNGRPNSTLILGVILVLLGIVFLVQNVTDVDLGNWNWWALFILIPAIASLGAAWRVYQSQGRFVPAVRGPLVGGLVLLLVATILLFDLDWGTMWPLFLVIAGVGALLAR